jgi:hypothetical protein
LMLPVVGRRLCREPRRAVLSPGTQRNQDLSGESPLRPRCDETMTSLRSVRLPLMGALSAGSLAAAAYLAAPSLWPGPIQKPPQQIVSVSIIMEQSEDFERRDQFPPPPGSLIAGIARGDRNFRSTHIAIVYSTPIDVNQTAAIDAVLRQELDSVPLVGGPGAWTPDYSAPRSDMDPPRHIDVPALPFAVTLRMEGIGLDWTQQDIAIRKGTPLAITVSWAPRAKAAGDYTLRFPLKDINAAVEANGYGRVSDTVVVTINGEKHEHHGSDDVTLPLSVHKYGLSAPELDWARALGSGFLALFGAGCGATLLKWLFERKGSRNHGKQDRVRAKDP